MARAKVVWPPPLPQESAAEKTLRLQKEAEAKRISDSIDAALNAEREQKKRAVYVKILLLGQAESGKSTVLKNFQLHFSPKQFQAEAEVWRPIIHLNLIRSVNFILNTLSPQPTVSSDTNEIKQGVSLPAQDPQPFDDLSSELKRIFKRLLPLRQVEESLTRQLTGNLTNDVIEQTSYHPAKAPEISVHSNSGWKGLMNFRRQSFTSAKSEEMQNRRILSACTDDVIALWKDVQVQRILGEKEISLRDQPGFFLDDVKRIASENYKPAPDDILRARVQTIGPEEHNLCIENAIEGARDWKIYDVGGSRSQRAAWAQFFDDVNVIIFLAPMSAFNQTLAEDENTNRLTDSLKLWQMIVTNKLLQSVELIVFLNKLDILDSKLKSGVQFCDYVTSYKPRPNETKPVAKYLLDVFVTLHQQHSPRKRKIHPHMTCAIDTRATSVVINQIQEVILMKILSSTNIL